MVDFVEICNVCARKAIIGGVKRIINFDKMCRSYSDLNFGVTFFGTQCSTCSQLTFPSCFLWRKSPGLFQDMPLYMTPSTTHPVFSVCVCVFVCLVFVTILIS